MEFTHEFVIPRTPDEALEVLTDLERVAPCMPGATLEEVDGDTYSGRVKVKVGPMSLTYAGDATVTAVDHDAKTARIEASGREKRGSGTASADVDATLEEVEGGTKVIVTTDINITGKPAQFGRGVMADVGGAIITRFAENLQAQLEEEDSEPEEEAAAEAPEAAEADESAESSEADEAAAPAAGGKRKVEARAPRDEALDILDVAGDTTTAKVVPVVAAVLALLLVIWFIKRGDEGDDGEE